MSDTPFYILTDDSFSMYYTGKLVTCTSDIASWDDLREAVRQEDWARAAELVDQEQVVKTYLAPAAEQGVEVRDGAIFYNGDTLHGALVDRILGMRSQGFNVQPMVAFLENLQGNPSYRSREQLYGFLEANKLPITPDGCFMAYKRIRDDWTDCATGKFDNAVGSTLQMPRTDVDDDPTRTCSAGFHVCSLEYLKHFWGERVVAVKVNPAHVVAVPTDYHNSKMRVEQYTVIEELPLDLVQSETDHWNTAVAYDGEDDVAHVVEHRYAELWITDAHTWTDNVDEARVFASFGEAQAFIDEHKLPAAEALAL